MLVTIKCEKKKNKRTTECNESTARCNIDMASCNNEIITCVKKKKIEPLNMTKVQ